MRSYILTFALVAMTACASSSGQIDAARPRQNVVFSGPDAPTIFTDKEHAVAISINKPQAVVYAAVKKVYGDLEVPLTVDDARNHQLGNADFFKARQFGGKAMTQFVDCGSGITGPNAASYRIYMSLLSTVMDDGKGGTSVKTTLTASARDLAGGSSTDKLPCSTTGRLESMLHDRVVAITGS